jgi:hypothetical protein
MGMPLRHSKNPVRKAPRRIPLWIAPADLPGKLPNIRLRHGETLWVLSRLGFRGDASSSTFYEYIKSLRKLGTPFDRRSIGYPRRGLANYKYCHLMELALVLALRVYYVVPDSLLSEIIRYRHRLNRLYRRAYAERSSGLGAPITVQTSGRDAPIHIRGAFLDLQMNYSGGRLEKFGPPRLISPFDALAVYAASDLAARAFLPINLSLLCEQVVTIALRAPLITRGPHKLQRRR